MCVAESQSLVEVYNFLTFLCCALYIDQDSKMSEGVIPGLDGDIPSERRLLPDSLTAMRAKDGASTVAFGGQQSATEPGRDAARDHPPKVSFVTFVVVRLSEYKSEQSLPPG